MKNNNVTTTYKQKLCTKHIDWVEKTITLYQKITEFYYSLLLKRREILLLSNQQAMRQLEIITIGQKNKKEAIIPIPYKKVPVYFRRAAINAAIGHMRSYQAKLRNWEKGTQIGTLPQPSSQIKLSPVYYKGMYKEMTQKSILLKLWTGKSWTWVKYHFLSIGQKIPESGECLSPIIKLKKKSLWLHIPVAVAITDTRTMQERIRDGEKLCIVSFPRKGNHLAVSMIMDNDGTVLDYHFISGARQLKDRRKRYLGKIKRSLSSRGNKNSTKIDNKRWYQKMKQLNHNIIHQLSRKIVNYCLLWNAKVILVENSVRDFVINQKMQYGWLGRGIVSKLAYKSLRENIVMVSDQLFLNSWENQQNKKSLNKMYGLGIYYLDKYAL